MSKPSPLLQVENPFLNEEPAPDDLDPVAAATGQEQAPPPVEEEAPPTEETPPETPENTVETTETKVRQPSRKDLSTQLETATAELQALRDQGAVYDQKYKDAVAKQTELEQKLVERDTEYVKKRTPEYKWEDDPEVATPRREIVEILNDAAMDLAPESSKILSKDLTLILSAFGEARTNGAEALQLFKEKLTTAFGEDSQAVLTTVRQIYPKHVTALEAQNRNSTGFFSKALTEHATRSRALREEFLQIGRMSPEQIASSPDLPNAIISAAVAGDETLVKEIERMALQAAQATAGLPPLPANATPEQIEAYRTTERNLHQFKETQAFRRDVEARVLAAIVKKQQTEIDTLRKRVPAAAEANRPESTSSSTSTGKKDDIPTGEFRTVENPYLTGR